MFAALHIPDFPVAAALRGRQAEWSLPAAVLATAVKTKQAQAPLLALNPAARGAGLEPGWPLSKALVRCPNIRLLERDPEAESNLRKELVEWAESFTPDLEISAEDTVLLDLRMRIDGSERLSQTNALNGISIWFAEASTPDLADLAVRHPMTRGRVVGSADLAELPIGVLGQVAGGERRHGGMAWAVLDLWGIRTLGDFMRLPRQALAERLGPVAGYWHDVLHGRVCRPLRLHRVIEPIADGIELEEPETRTEALVFVVKRLLQTISQELSTRRLAAGSLRVALGLEGGVELARELRLAEPQAGEDGMLAVVRIWLEGLQLEAGVVRVAVEAVATFGTAVQREWFGRRELPQPQRWAETLGRLEAMLGRDRVGIPVPPESFKPDGFSLRPGLGGSGVLPNGDFRPEVAVPLRRYRPALEVAVAGEWRGSRHWPLAVLTGIHAGRVVGWRGPFPVSGQWWDPEEAWQRLEWDVAMEAHELLRLVWQRPERWQIDGVYG